MNTPTMGDRAFFFVVRWTTGAVLFVVAPLLALALLVFILKSLWLLV
jgi:hypothetical protein